METNTHTIWDAIIVGGGPAGCAAAIVLARMRRKVLLIDEGKHRNQKSHGIHNYLTRDSILPADFLSEVHKDLDKYKIPIVKARAIKAEPLAQHGFAVWDSNGNKHIGKRLLAATGVTDNIPDIPGIHELWGELVVHCPFCDGWECCDKQIGVYASRFNGYGMSIALKQLSEHVILFTDGSSYLKPRQKAQLAVRNIEVVTTRITGITKADNGMVELFLKKQPSRFCERLFTHHGNKVNNELVKQLGVRCSNNGAIPVNKNQACNILGVYLAGDVVYDVQFVAVAAAEGVKAAVAIHNDLLKIENSTCC